MRFYDKEITEKEFKRLKAIVLDSFGLDRLKKAYASDKYLNNIPLRFWDNLAIFVDIRGFALSQKVWLLKIIARMAITDKPMEECIYG